MSSLLEKVESLVIRKGAGDEAEVVTDVTDPGNPATRTQEIKKVEEHGAAPIVWIPFLNRGTNFTPEERRRKRLEGLVPPAVEPIELQAERVMLQLHDECPNSLAKYELLAQLAATNVSLLYYVLIHNLEQLAPIVYTPTVGEACQKFDRIFRQSLGMYFDCFNQRGRFREIMDNWFSHSVQIIVVTDGGRILGLGDLGTNGMGIPVGKIQLYVGVGGFHPEHSLPAQLDVGTCNEELLKDKFYLGNKKKRLDGKEHMAAVEEFCMAAKNKWPNVLIQFEDFPTDKAFDILDRMRDKVLCFNDDIQGTGAVTTAGFINGMKAQHTPLKDARIVFYGAGSSAVGVATMIAQLISKETGMPFDEAKKHIYMMDSKGLITTKRGDKLPEHKKLMAHGDDVPVLKDLKDVIAHVKPHALIGLTGAGPAFKKEDIEEMLKYCDKPLIFPLSNPSSKAEITAEKAYEYAHGKCVYASGSPEEPVKVNGKTVKVGQCNNFWIFPGVGFGAVMSKSKKVTDEMFLAAARALADFVTPEQIEQGQLYPEAKDLRKVAATVATAVADEAIKQGVARIKRPADLRGFIEHRMWDPEKPHLNATTPLTTPMTTPMATPQGTPRHSMDFGSDVKFPQHKPMS
ncbi:g4539 [Coccomyxa viridis]|uniref:Malic enzyme n=1 Tax=Coccomyxa viridis TaxID=1274662 RepID=A0ABP1FVJ6_9CHLO